MNDVHNGSAPLSGIQVLDFTQGVAGPHATMMAALNGADVIKVEPLDGDWGRTLGKAYADQSAHSIAFNRGKRSIAANLKDPKVRKIMQEMAASADVIVESFRPGVMARFGLDFESLSKTKPDLIYLSVTGFGQSGPNRDLPVTDAVIQAYSGWMTMNKSRDGMPQRTGMVAIDVMTGLYAYQAISNALLARFRFGRGQYIDCSLMQSAAAFQSAKIIEQALEGGGEVQALYAPVGAFQTADGIINISTMRDSHFEALCKVLQRPDMNADPRYNSRAARLDNEAELMSELQKTFMSRSAAEWSAELSKADVINSIVLDYPQFLSESHVQKTGAFSWVEMAEVGSVPMPKVPGFPTPAEMPSSLEVPAVGEHSRQILQAQGLDAGQVDSLVEAGVIGAG